MKYFVDDTSLTSVADAIRAKGGTNEPLFFPDGFVSAVESISTGSVEGLTLDDFVQKNLFVGDVVLNKATSIRQLAFYKNTGITSLTSGTIGHIGSAAFQGCTNLESVNLPKGNITYYDSNHFQGCTNLKYVNLPEVTIGSNYMFANCSSLESITLPKMTSGTNRLFEQCTKLKKYDGVLTSIPNRAFTNCTSLDTLILRGNTVASLPDTNLAIGGTPFATDGTGGTVYCKAELIPQYQTATNWSVLYEAGTCTFLPIEGSEYE